MGRPSLNLSPEEKRRRVNERKRNFHLEPKNLERRRAQGRKDAKKFRAKLTPEQIVKKNEYMALRYANSQAVRDKVKAQVRRGKLAREYGMTEKQWEEMLLSQDNKCAICGCETSGGKGGWHTDHCHITGKVRGLLCQGCNIGLGGFKDNPKSLRAAADYLEMAKGKTDLEVQRQLISSPGNI